MTMLLLFVNACQSTSVSSFCLWFEPITFTQEEFDTMSEETLRQIDNVNGEYEKQCGK